MARFFPDRPLPLGTAGLLAAIMLAEHGFPLRRQTQREPVRTLRNLTLGVLSMGVVAALEAPITRRLAVRAEARRRGAVQRVPSLPRWARDALAVLTMDYTIYVWHILTHKVPLLWRFHLVHHLDLDLDASTALRFHAADMLISIPYRAAQVALIGVSPRALRVWQAWFFVSILFHHSNLRLPWRLESWLALLFTTPRMHGIHHTAAEAETNANWSSGLSVWDRLHGTFRLDTFKLDGPRPGTRIGVPAYGDARQIGMKASLALPFLRQRDAWTST